MDGITDFRCRLGFPKGIEDVALFYAVKIFSTRLTDDFNGVILHRFGAAHLLIGRMRDRRSTDGVRYVRRERQDVFLRRGNYDFRRPDIGIRGRQRRERSDRVRRPHSGTVAEGRIRTGDGVLPTLHGHEGFVISHAIASGSGFRFLERQKGVSTGHVQDGRYFPVRNGSGPVRRDGIFESGRISRPNVPIVGIGG